MTQRRIENDRLLRHLTRIGDIGALGGGLEIVAVAMVQGSSWTDFTVAGD